jgi:hypothetical protein
VKKYLKKLIKWKDNSKPSPYTPVGFHKDTYQWMLANGPNGINSIENYYEFHKKESISRKFPNTIDAEMYWKFELDYGDECQTGFVASLEKARFWDGSAVIAPDNKLLSDVSIHMRVDPQKPNKHPVFWKDIKAPEIIDKSVAILSAPGGNTYFHWIVDVLPRLFLTQQYLEKSGKSVEYFIVNSLSQKFQRQTISLLGVPREKIIESEKFPHIAPQKLITPSFIRHSTCNIGSWAFNFLRDSFIKKAKLKSASSETPEYLYISRAKASSRNITNEADVYGILEKKGFVKIFLETLNIEEQVSLFASAKCIISPHGAGLTNLVFCPEGTKILEIYSPNYVSVSYWNISSQIGLDYYYLFGTGKRPEKFSDPHTRGEDITVDLGEFKDTLDLMNI